MRMIHKLGHLSVLALLFSLWMTPSNAAPFQNGSFESPVLASGFGIALDDGSTNITGWTVNGTGIGWQNGPAFGVSPIDGAQHIGFNGGNAAPGASISQTFDTVAGQSYRVSYDLGRVGTGFGVMSLSTTVRSDSGAALAGMDAIAPDSPGYGPLQSFTFVATSTTSTLEFLDTSSATVAVDPVLDNVSVVEVPPCVPAASGLVSWWRADGNARDSVDSANGTLTGSVAYVPGKVGEAFLLDGDHDGVLVGNPPSLRLQDFTIEAWIKRTSATKVSITPEGGVVFGYGVGGYALALTDSGQLFITRIEVSAAFSSLSVTDTNWHHVAVTKSGSSLVFYVDGIGDQVSYSDVFSFGANAAVGARGDTFANGFLGIIDEVGIYKRALNASEVQSIFSAGAGGKCLAANISFSPNGGAFLDSVSVSIGVTGSTGAVYYTLNGSDPTTNSLLYAGAVLLTNSVTLKAAVFEGNTRVSDIASAEFSILNSSSDCVTIPGLAGWWKGEGNALDTAGPNHGTLAGNAGYTAGRSGQAFRFDGDSDGVFLGNPPSLQFQNFSIEAWIKRSDTTKASYDIFGDGAIFGYGYNGTIFAVLDGGTLALGKIGISAVFSSATVTDTNWHHVAVTKTGSAVTFYIDGTGETVATPYDPGFLFWTEAHIGAVEWSDSTPRQCFLGAIDEVGVYNRGLSATEVQLIFLAGASGKCPPKARALAHWSFDETNGSVAHDSAGSYDGTLSPAGALFDTNGVSGGAISLNKASNGFVNMGNVLGLTSGDFSLVAWVRTASGETAECSDILTKVEPYSANGYLLEINACGTYAQTGKAWFYDSDNVGQELVGTTTVNDGNWHQVVAVYEAGGNKYIYVDGAPMEASGPSLAIVPNTASFMIGGVAFSGVPTGRFTGLIDEVQVYNYALSTTDVDYLFANPSQVIPEHDMPVGWRLNALAGAGGSVARDPNLSRYTNGAPVTLTATANAGFTFTGWTGDATGTNNPLTITMSSDKAITANFAEAVPPIVTIASPVAGTNTDDMFVLSGDVTDNLAGVSARWEWNGQPVGGLSLNGNGHFSVPGLRFYQGDNHLKVIGRDAAGNETAAEVVVTWRPMARALAHWSFDETSGTVAHDSSGTYNGNLSSTGAAFDTNGFSGGAINLSKASNGYVDMGNVLGLTSGDFSLVAWVKTPPGDTTECSEIISKHDAGAAVGYLMELNACFATFPYSGKVWIYDSAQPGQELASTTSVNDGSWHQVVVTYQAGGSKYIYVDGGPAEGSKPSVPIVPNAGSFVIGGVTVAGNPESRFTGLIDEVQIYNYALTGTDVDFLFANPSQAIPDHDLPVGWSLNTSANGGGSVQRNPDLARYPDGTNITLTAVANAGFVFGGWSGDASGTNNPLSVTMNGNKTIVANFHDGTAPVISITTPSGGTNSDERFQLTGTITDNHAVGSANWEWNGQSIGPLTLVSNQFSVTSLKLKLGENRIRVNATDLDGNPASAEVVVTWAPDRTLSIVGPGPAQEGLLISVPVQLNSGGEVGGVSFVMRYDTNYLAGPDLAWGGVVGSALNQVNYDVPGEVRATFALPATAVPAGLQTVATVEFRARSVPFDLTTLLGLELRDVSRPTGDTIASGSYAQSGDARILMRRVVGDDNANDLLDVGDATIILKLLTGLDPVRSWDVSGNDVNANTSLDSGDVIKVMRAVVGLDPQPTPQSTTGSHRTLSKAGKGKAGGVVGRVALGLDKQRAQVGELVTLQVRLEGNTEPLAGASFTVNYPTNALRLLNSASSRAGALVPGTAVAIWNVEPGQSNYATQNGHESFGASSANSWPTNNGVLAELVFEVQAGQTGSYLWPVTVTGVKAANGYDPAQLSDQAINFIGRNQIPPTFGSSVSYSGTGGVQLTLSGEPGVVYAIETSEDLVHWSPLTTVTGGAGPATVSDANATSHTHRFYRATAQ